MLVLAVFPRLLDKFAEFVGIYSSVNALFAFTLFFALMLILSLTSIVSREKQEIVRLIQELAVLENRLKKQDKKRYPPQMWRRIQIDNLRVSPIRNRRS